MENKKLNIGDMAFELMFPEKIDSPWFVLYKDWLERIKSSNETQKDEWSEIYFLPGYKFKNLKIIPNIKDEELQESELSFNFKFDEYEKRKGE
jgi:hypothetical protein